MLVRTSLDVRHSLPILIEKGLINLPKYGEDQSSCDDVLVRSVGPEVRIISKTNCKMGIGPPL